MSRHRILEEIRVPEPFDRSIAHVEISTKTNDLTSGMDVSISAFFGREQVSFSLDDGGVLDADCEVRQAHIEVKHFNCSSLVLDETAAKRVAGFSAETVRLDSQETTSSTTIDGSANGEASTTKFSGLAKLKLGRGKSTEHNASISEKSSLLKEQVEIGADHIRIAENLDSSPLSGKIVNLPDCWRIKPIDPSKPYAILVELRVRRNWMPLSKPVLEKGQIGFKETLSKLWKGGAISDEFHRQAFTLLLEHLVKRGLQSEDEATYAMLAAQALVAAPTADPLESVVVSAPATRRAIVLPSDLLFQALTYPPTQIAHLLSTEGVEASEIKALVDQAASLDEDAVIIESGRTKITTRREALGLTKRAVKWFRDNW